MSDKMFNDEGYPSDPKERAMEQRLEQMLAELPTAKAPPEIRAEIMAELRATGPGLGGRLRHWWAGLGAWRVPLQVAPAVALVFALVVTHQIVTSNATRQGASDIPVIAAAPESNGIDGTQIASVPEVNVERAPAVIKLVPDFEMPVEKPVDVAVAPAPPIVEVVTVPDEPAAGLTSADELEVIPAVLNEVAEAPDIPRLAPTIVATPVGAGTEEQIQERESAFTIQSERIGETLIAEAPQTPSMTIASVPIDEGTAQPANEGPIHIEAERLNPDEIATLRPRPSAPSNDAANESTSPGALAFHGAPVTADQMLAQRTTSGLAVPPRTQTVESMRFETDDPFTVADQARTLVRTLDGYDVARVPVTNDRNVWVVSATMPRFQLDALRMGMVMLSDAGAAALASELPEFEEPSQIPPAERREIRVEITISRRP